MSVLKLESTLVGVAGEYFVAAELSLRSTLASITFRNNCGIDIVASNVDALRTVSIQVKTNKCGASSWMLGRKSETFFSETHFYVFVALRVVGERPDFFVAPSTDVANFVRTSHSRWLEGTK